MHQTNEELLERLTAARDGTLPVSDEEIVDAAVMIRRKYPTARPTVAEAAELARARIGGLLAVAVLPPLAGISGEDYRDAAAFSDGYSIALWICAGLCALGGVLAFLTIRRPMAGPEPQSEPVLHCPLEAPPRASAARG